MVVVGVVGGGEPPLCLSIGWASGGQTGVGRRRDHSVCTLSPSPTIIIIILLVPTLPFGLASLSGRFRIIGHHTKHLLLPFLVSTGNMQVMVAVSEMTAPTETKTLSASLLMSRPL